MGLQHKSSTCKKHTQDLQTKMVCVDVQYLGLNPFYAFFYEIQEESRVALSEFRSRDCL